MSHTEHVRLEGTDVPTTSRRLWLALILLAAVAMGQFRLSWGVPGYVFPDGYANSLLPAMWLVAKSDFRLSQAAFFHGTILIYLLSIVFFVYSHLTGQPIVPTASMFELPAPELIVLGRETGVVLATASIAALYLVARRLVGSRAALFAAAALTLSPLYVLESHRINPDQTTILLGLIAAHQALVARERRSVARLAMAFAIAGLSGATKYTGLATVSVPVWIALSWHDASWLRRCRFVVGGGVAALVAFSIAMAPALLDPARLLAGYRTLALATTLGMPGTDLYGQSWTNVRYLYTTLVVLPYAMGWPVYLAGIAGIIVLARGNPVALGVVLAGAGPLFLVQGGALVQVPRYLEPLVPYLALAAGAAFDRLWTTRRTVGIALATAAFAYTVVLTGSQLVRLGLAPQRQVAAFIAARARADNAAGRPLVIGYQDSFVFFYDTVRPLMNQTRTRLVYFPDVYHNVRAEPRDPPVESVWRQRDREWITANGVEVIILPEWVELAVTRERPDGYAGSFFRRLGDGTLGFRLAAYYRTDFFTEGLYTWAEPMFRTHWETAISGYKVFVRDGTVPAAAAPPRGSG